MKPFVLGMDFGGTKTALATADEQGEILERQNLSTLSDAEQAISRALEAAQHLIFKTQDRYHATLHTVGVATMGITQNEGVFLAPNVTGWNNLQLPKVFKTTFGDTPVLIANDVKSAALAETKWGALEGIDPGIFVNLGTGIAVAIVAQGLIVQGAHGASGEIAYNPLSENDRSGVRDGFAPLENKVGGGPIQHQALRELGLDLSAGEIFRRARHNPAIRLWVDSIVRTLSFQLSHLVIALDPQRVVVGGGLVNARDMILPPLIQYFEEFVPFPPQVVPAHFQGDASLMGALAMAMDASQKFIKKF